MGRGQRELLRKMNVALWAIIRCIHRNDSCPCCGCNAGRILGRKNYLFLVRKCAECGLFYRIPTQLAPQFYEKYYHRNSNWWQGYLDGTLAEKIKIKF